LSCCFIGDFVITIAASIAVTLLFCHHFVEEMHTELGIYKGGMKGIWQGNFQRTMKMSSLYIWPWGADLWRTFLE
jgi:hypothetical protein